MQTSILERAITLTIMFHLARHVVLSNLPILNLKV